MTPNSAHISLGHFLLELNDYVDGVEDYGDTVDDFDAEENSFSNSCIVNHSYYQRGNLNYYRIPFYFRLL